MGFRHRISLSSTSILAVFFPISIHNSRFKMGAWGYGLLQSDAELDVVDEIEDEVAKVAKTKRFRLLHPKHPARVKERLDGGVFHRAFLYFQKKKWNHGVSTAFFFYISYILS